MLTEFVKVAMLGDLADGQMKAVEFGNEKILLAKIKGEHFAIANVCSHFYALLSDGELISEECVVRCPLHDSRFDLRTGEPIDPPADDPVEVYAIRIEGDEILVGPRD